MSFNEAGYGSSVFFIILLLFLPAAMAIKDEVSTKMTTKIHPISSELEIVVAQPPMADVPVVRPSPPTDEGCTILQAVCSLDMVILLITMACGFGGSFTAVNNLGQIGASLGYQKRSISMFVSLVSICSFFGRFFVSFAGLPRLPTMMMILTLISVSASYLLIAFNVPYGLYVASAVIGFGLGARGPLLMLIISELFGVGYNHTIFSFGRAVATLIGGYVLSVNVTGYLYDKEAKRQMLVAGLVRNSGTELDCKGEVCFRLAFIIITCVTVFGAFMAGVLVMRTRGNRAAAAAAGVEAS